jgi:CDP-paratose 2-epimerase
MSVVLVTGSGGLIGSEAAKFFHEKGFEIVGIDNNMRSYFFGESGDVSWNISKIKDLLFRYTHFECDIRDFNSLKKIFSSYNKSIAAVIHTAAQPSHDWAAKEPLTDFSVNANGTLNLLECTRLYSPEAVFIFTSTNKVYGDSPNFLPLIENENRWELSKEHVYSEFGIDESMTIDNSKHSVFGASKVAADIMVQEYGRYFGLKSASFRGGCLTGPSHSGAELHGFLSYLIKCALDRKKYTVFGYKGKQVRDNIHSEDLVNAFWHFFQDPRNGEVYNIGGSRHSNISMLEAIEQIQTYTGIELDYTIDNDNARSGDHIWYISDIRKFQKHFPSWKYRFDMDTIIKDMIDAYRERKK